MILYRRTRVETLHRVMRHLPRDENKLVAPYCRDEPSGWRRGNAMWIHLAEFPARLGITATSEIEIVELASRNTSVP